MPILKESDANGYLFGTVQIQGQASKPNGRQQLRLFLRRHDLRQDGDGTIRHADDRRVFLRPHLVGSGGRTAAASLQIHGQRQYSKANVVNSLMEKIAAKCAIDPKPTSSERTGRSVDELRAKLNTIKNYI